MSKLRRRAPLLGLLVALMAALLLPQGTVAHADAGRRGGDFIPLTTPGRVLDTRNGTGGTTGVRGPATTTTFPVLGHGGVPSTGVSAVMIDLVAFGATEASTYLVMYPEGQARPGVSSVLDKDISNTSVIPLPPSGKISVYNNKGNTHLVADVHGYFTTGIGPKGGFVPIQHTKLVDTRDGTGTAKRELPANGSITVTIGGGVVPTTASAAFLDIAVTGAEKAGWLHAYPAAGSLGNGTLDYGIGVSSSGAPVRLGANGQVTLTNKGSSAVNVTVTAEGYFASDSSQGAGLRQAMGRLPGSGTEIAKGGTLDVQVGGRLGLPTKGVAGVAANFTVVGQTKAGHLRAWPLGSAEPATSLTQFEPGEGRAGMAIVKPGNEGKIRVRNVSEASVKLYVDVQGWFADAMPPLNVASYTPTTVIQATPQPAAVGALEHAYVDNLGKVMTGHQPDLDNAGSVQWAPLSGLEAFTGQPALSPAPGDKTLIAALNTDGTIWTSTTPIATVNWSPWINHGLTAASPPTVARNPDGTPVLFAVDTDGRLWHMPYQGANSEWSNFGDFNIVGTPAHGVVRDGGIRLFVVDTAGVMLTAEYRGGTLSPWTSLGGSGLKGRPSVVVYPGYRARVFIQNADGRIVTKLQNVDGTFPADWDAVGDLVSAGSPSSIVSPTSGKTQVVIRGLDDEVYRIAETEQASGVWDTWRRALESWPVKTDPQVMTYTNVNGVRWALSVRNINNFALTIELAG
jgi:hypothetical protein